jgi:hypothetical protein
MPDFPSCTPNHATLSGGMARIIGAWFRQNRGMALDRAMPRGQPFVLN